METFLFVVGCLTIVATALPLIKSDVWWIRVFDFPRLQLTVIAAAVLVVYLIWDDRIDKTDLAFLSVLSAGLAYQVYMMFPYTRLSAKQVQSSRVREGASVFSLLFANVLMTNRSAQRLLDLIKKLDPDVVLIAEPDNWWAEQLRDLDLSHPYSVKKPQENTYGLMLFSRLELRDAKLRFLISDDIPSIHGTLVLNSGVEVDIRCLHPRPPFPTEDATSTSRDAELLIVGREIKHTKTPAVVFGDLNDVAWSRTNYLFQDISGLLDPRIGRGFFHTFHASHPLIRFPLDHFFHSNHFRLVDFQRLPYFGSDHFPVFIKLSYEPDAARVQEELQAEPEEKAEAVEKILAAVEKPT